MPNDYEFIPLDLYQECIEPSNADTHSKMATEKDPMVYEHASQWTTIYPNSPTDLS